MTAAGNWRDTVRILSAVAAAYLLALAGCARVPVTVGFVGPLTGPSSIVGQSGRNGFALAFADYDRVRTIVKDDKNDAEACLAAVKELRDAGCRIVVLGTTSQTATKALPWATENGLLVVSPTVSASIPGTRTDRYVKVNVPSAEYGIALARLAARREGKMRVAIAADTANREYVEAVETAFSAEYAQLGGTVPFVRYFDSKSGSVDTEIPNLVRRYSCDGLLAIAASSETVRIAKYLEKESAGIQLFLPPWPLTLDLLENGGAAVEGALAVSISDLEYSSPRGKRFEERYRAVYGVQPSFIAMFGYEAATILRKVLAEGSGAEPEAVRERILAHREFEGIQGSIVFDEQGRARRDVFVFTIRGGAFEAVE